MDAIGSPDLLPLSPRSLVVGGEPLAGLWSGEPEEAGIAGLSVGYPAGWRRRLVEKRWVYALVASPDLFLCLAIVDAGLLCAAFVSLFDRRRRTLLADRSLTLLRGPVEVADSPGAGLRAELRSPQARASIVRAGAQVRIGVEWAPVVGELILELGEAPTGASRCAPLGEPFRFSFTQKRVLLPAHGELRLGGEPLPLREATAGLDFTHGLLRRETSWRWAFGLQGGAQSSAGRAVAFNLSEGIDEPGSAGGSSENVVWLDGAPRPVGPVRFELGRAGLPGGPWRIRSGDGAVDLTFAPEGQRAQDTNVLGLLTSRYVQPFGSFSGRIALPGLAPLELEKVPGVTEDHFARW